MSRRRSATTQKEPSTNRSSSYNKKKAVEWPKKNGLKGVTSKNFHAAAGNQDDGQKGGLIAHCMRETERGVYWSRMESMPRS